MKKIAILLTVHNRKEKTLNCLRRVYDQLPLDKWETHIYLTDDGCTDGTPEAIRKQFPTVNIIIGNGDLFWNHGMIAAWEAAFSDYDYDAYLWLNDDTMLYPDALEELLKAHSQVDNSIIVGVTQNYTKDKVTYGGRKNGQLLVPNGEIQECDTFNGNVVLVPKSVFHEIGFLDSAYTHSIGDIDYGMTAAEHNIKNFITPSYIGTCENNPVPPKWLRPDVPFKERLNNLFSPFNYSNPPEYYHFKKKHWGHGHAILAMFSIGLRFLAPRLWRFIRRPL